MNINSNDTAVVFTDPSQGSAEGGDLAWPLVRESIHQNNTGRFRTVAVGGVWGFGFQRAGGQCKTPIAKKDGTDNPDRPIVIQPRVSHGTRLWGRVETEGVQQNLLVVSDQGIAFVQKSLLETHTHVLQLERGPSMWPGIPIFVRHIVDHAKQCLICATRDPTTVALGDSVVECSHLGYFTTCPHCRRAFR